MNKREQRLSNQQLLVIAL